MKKKSKQGDWKDDLFKWMGHFIKNKTTRTRVTNRLAKIFLFFDIDRIPYLLTTFQRAFGNAHKKFSASKETNVLKKSQAASKEFLKAFHNLPQDEQKALAQLATFLFLTLILPKIRFGRSIKKILS